MTTTANDPTRTPPAGSANPPGRVAPDPRQWLDAIALEARGRWAEDDIEIDGLRHCQHCRTPKEIEHDLREHGTHKTATLCQCNLNAIRMERREIEQAQAEQRKKRIRETAFNGGEMTGHTMGADDAPESPYSRFVQRYIDEWDSFRDEGIGMILAGGVGTGKTFYAAAIANAVIDKGDRAHFITVPDVVEAAWDKEDWNRLLSKVDTYELLVLDDLGAERDTEYSIQQVFSVINRRIETGLPLIVTTNLSIPEMKDRPTLESRRVYDRITEACPLELEIKGQSRRSQKGQSRKDRAREIMQGGSTK